MKGKDKKRSLKNIFTSSVSFTGGDRLVSKHVLRRRLWLCVIILAMAALCYHLSTLVTEFQEYPVNTVLNQHVFSFWFPDVTICPGLPFSENKKPSEGIGISNAKRFWNYAMKYNTSILNQRKSFMNAMDSFQTFAYERDIYSSLLDSIHYCIYLGKPCFRSNFTVTRHPLRLNCITFVPHHRRIVIPEKEAGLHIIFTSEESYSTYDPMNELHKTHGFEVIIHEQYSLPPVQKDTNVISAGQHLTLKLKMKKHVRYDTPPNRCYTRDEVIAQFKNTFSTLIPREEIEALKFTGTYTEDDCLNIITQKFSIGRCNCLQDRVYLPWNISLDVKGCHSIPREFFYNDAIDKNGILRYKDQKIDLKTNSEFKEIVKRAKCSSDRVLTYINDLEIMDDEMNSCRERCEKIIYTVDSTSSKWPASKKHLRNTLTAYHGSKNKFSQNFVNITDRFKYLSSILVYPSDLSVVETKEYLAYPMSQLLADFGGNIGLWVGCSILTFAELMEFFVRVFFQKREDKKEKLESSQKDIEENQVL